MDIKINGWKDRRMDIHLDGHMDGRANGHLHEEMRGRIYGLELMTRLKMVKKMFFTVFGVSWRKGGGGRP